MAPSNRNHFSEATQIHKSAVDTIRHIVSVQKPKTEICQNNGRLFILYFFVVVGRLDDKSDYFFFLSLFFGSFRENLNEIAIAFWYLMAEIWCANRFYSYLFYFLHQFFLAFFFSRYSPVPHDCNGG